MPCALLCDVMGLCWCGNLPHMVLQHTSAPSALYHPLSESIRHLQHSCPPSDLLPIAMPSCAPALLLQARMQRNRENAQLSRQRKKQQMEDLQVGRPSTRVVLVLLPATLLALAALAVGMLPCMRLSSGMLGLCFLSAAPHDASASGAAVSLQRLQALGQHARHAVPC